MDKDPRSDRAGFDRRRRPRASVSVPPDAEAIRAALTPPRRRTRYGPLIGVAAIAIGMTLLSGPKHREPDPEPTTPGAAGEPAPEVVWNGSLAIDTVLEPDAPGRRRQRMHARLVLAFRPVDPDDPVRVERAIRSGRAEAVRAVEAHLSRVRPREMLHVDGALERQLAELLTATLFADGDATVTRVSWRAIEFQSAD